MADGGTNPDWYRLMYSLAAAYANRSAQREAESDQGPAERDQRGSWEDAYKAAALANYALAAGANLPRNAGPVGDLFDKTLAPSLIVLWAGAIQTMERQGKFGIDRPPDMKGLPIPASTVASGSPRSPGQEPASPRPSHDGVARTLQRLLRPAPPAEPNKVAMRLGEDPQINYRVAYNLACYWSQAGSFRVPSNVNPANLCRQAVDRAPAGQSTRLAAQALNDPSLSALLRSDPKLKDYLRRIAQPAAQRTKVQGREP